MKNKILILLILALSSCIGLNIPSDQKKAGKKLGTALELVEGITNAHPELKDSVQKPVLVKIGITADSLEAKLSIDSNRIADFFTKEYDPLLKKRDSLIKLLESDLTNREAVIEALRELDATEGAITKKRQEVVREVYPDTTMQLQVSTPMVINGDTSNIKVNAHLDISEKGLTLTLSIPEQTIETEVQSTHPIFTVYRKIDWYWWVLFLLAIGLIIRHLIGRVRR